MNECKREASRILSSECKMSIKNYFNPVQADAIAIGASSVGLSITEEVEITKEIKQVTQKDAKKRK